MILSPEELQSLRAARLASSARASSMTLEEIAAQVSASGCEWKPNPLWTGPRNTGARRMPILEFSVKKSPVATSTASSSAATKRAS